MTELPGIRPLSSHSALLGTIALLGLTACATIPPSEEVAPSPQADAVEIGYGTIDRDRLTGSVMTVRSEDVEALQPKTLTEMLARLPGVRVIELHDGGISVRIRGSDNSIVGGNEPLFVLDGMPITSGDGEIRGINPNTVESITVLKDAGETAIYGSRGANGVILIKTKVGGR